MSLDGYIAGPRGEYDWIIMDPEIDFGALYAQFDTVLMGRRTFEPMAKVTGKGKGKSKKATSPMGGMKTFVVSRTLRQEDHPGVTIISDSVEAKVDALRREAGKDIWLFGGGLLYRSLAAAGLVDTIEVGVIPVVLGGGTPLVPSPAKQAKLTLTSHKVYKSGIVGLEYAVERQDGRRAARRP
jgi:dihydrofolate reductase